MHKKRGKVKQTTIKPNTMVDHDMAYRSVSDRSRRDTMSANSVYISMDVVFVNSECQEKIF